MKRKYFSIGILLKGESTHNSVKFVKSDMTEGIGPSMDVPCKSLQKKKTVFSYNKMQTLYNVILFFNREKVMDEPKFRLTIYQVWSSSQ